MLLRVSECLIYHIKSHQNIRDVMCEICGAAFRHRGSYNKHLKGHKGIREHKCDECAKSFRTKTELKTHKRTHTNIKEFICQVCNKAFRMKSHLGYHMRTHVSSATLLYMSPRRNSLIIFNLSFYFRPAKSHILANSVINPFHNLPLWKHTLRVINNYAAIINHLKTKLCFLCTKIMLF